MSNPFDSLKSFATSDGLAEIQLPATWEQDEEEPGTDAFGEPNDDAGVFRMTVMVYGREEPVDTEDLQSYLSQYGKPLRVHEDRYLAHDTDEFEEDGETVYQHLWTMAERTDEREITVVIASYTLGADESRADGDQIARQLEEALKACTLAEHEEAEEEEA